MGLMFVIHLSKEKKFPTPESRRSSPSIDLGVPILFKPEIFWTMTPFVTFIPWMKALRKAL
jgi:hypothetical protein